METQQLHLSFGEVKNLFKEAIDESQTVSSLFEIFIQKVYQKGWQDGVKRGIQTTYDYLELFRKK